MGDGDRLGRGDAQGTLLPLSALLLHEAPWKPEGAGSGVMCHRAL